MGLLVQLPNDSDKLGLHWKSRWAAAVGGPIRVSSRSAGWEFLVLVIRRKHLFQADLARLLANVLVRFAGTANARIIAASSFIRVDSWRGVGQDLILLGGSFFGCGVRHFRYKQATTLLGCFQI